MSTNRPTFSTLGATALATIAFLVALTAPAPAPAAQQLDQRKAPVRHAYEYRGTYTVEITHHVRLEYYHEGDGRFIDASASLSGRIPLMTMTKIPSGGIVGSMDSLRSSVRALSGAVDSTTVSDAGGTEVRCQGDSIWKTDKQHPFMVPDARGRLQFHPFATLSLPQTCRDNRGGDPTTSVHSFPELAARLKMSRDKFGDKHITIPFSAERSYPRAAGQDKDCPDSAESLTKECTYQVKGELELTRTRVYRPAPRAAAAPATVAGRIPRLRVSTIGHAGAFATDASPASVKAGTTSVDSTTTTNESEIEVRCTGSSMVRMNKQHPYLRETSDFDPVFYPFAVLALPQTCGDNQGGEPTKSLHSVPGQRATSVTGD